MYSMHNEVKSLIAERFIKTLTAKTYEKWQLMIANRSLDIWMNKYINAIILIILLIKNLLYY